MHMNKLSKCTLMMKCKAEIIISNSLIFSEIIVIRPVGMFSMNLFLKFLIDESNLDSMSVQSVSK